ncbi:MAG TPA: hypothetical protein EYP65_07910 [Armatimonadetes bacterium]|nr:hypothetical protein [Armatimonadota bacterium]
MRAVRIASCVPQVGERREVGPELPLVVYEEEHPSHPNIVGGLYAHLNCSRDHLAILRLVDHHFWRDGVLHLLIHDIDRHGIGGLPALGVGGLGGYFVDSVGEAGCVQSIEEGAPGLGRLGLIDGNLLPVHEQFDLGNLRRAVKIDRHLNRALYHTTVDGRGDGHGRVLGGCYAGRKPSHKPKDDQ